MKHQILYRFDARKSLARKRDDMTLSMEDDVSVGVCNDFSAKMSVAEPGIHDDWIGFLYMLVKILLK